MAHRAFGRRGFLGAAAVTAGGVALAACAAPAAPTPAPAKSVDPPPAATVPSPALAATPSAVPAAATKPAATAPTLAPAATPATAPATAPKPAVKPELGKSLIGKLEGPEIVIDPARIPKSFKEAPQLVELVKSGKLPPIEQRLPVEPLVVKPLREIGKYGGNWRRGFTGPADTENGNRIVSTDKLLFWDYTGSNIVPSVAKSWQVAEDGRTTTISLRKGMKWSDGQPFTTDDFIFWFQDIYQNKELVPTPAPELSVNGKAGTVAVIDDATVAFKFPEPHFLFLEILAGDTSIGGGQAGRQSSGFMGGYAPAHYLKQFHVKYASKDDLDKRIKEAGVENWVLLMKLKMAWQLNPDLPVLTPWKTTTPNNKPTWVLERNPYYWAVDVDGNQLPYIDKITMTQAENLEVLNLRAIAGEYDEQERHTDLGKLPVFLDNRVKGGYEVHLDTAANGSDSILQLNQTYDADPEIAKWLTNRDFRRALSLGIDRDQLNETFWLGVGTPGSIAPAEGSPYNPGPEYRKLWSTYDLKKANDMLDQIGLDKKDAQGMRLRSDGKGALRLEIWTAGAAFVPFTQHAEMIREQWRKIGVAANVTEMERSLAAKRVSNNEHHIYLWSNGGSELLYLFPQHALPVIAGDASYMAPLTASWYASNGQQGRKPTDPQMIKALDLFRSASGLKNDERIKTAREIWKILVEEQWSIGIVGLSPAFMGVRVASTKLGNIPDRQMNAQHCRTPGSSHPATFYFKS